MRITTNQALGKKLFVNSTSRILTSNFRYLSELKEELSLLDALCLGDSHAGQNPTLPLVKLAGQWEFVNARELLLAEINRLELSDNYDIGNTVKDKAANRNVVSSPRMNVMAKQTPVPLWSQMLSNSLSGHQQMCTPTNVLLQLKPTTSGKRLAQRESDTQAYNRGGELSWRRVSELK